MVSFIKVGHRYINAEHLVKVTLHDDKVSVVMVGMSGVEYYPAEECKELLDYVNYSQKTKLYGTN